MFFWFFLDICFFGVIFLLFFVIFICVFVVLGCVCFCWGVWGLGLWWWVGAFFVFWFGSG